MPLSVPCRAVLFDNDGVLVDSDESVVRAWTDWAGEYDLDPETVLDLVHGHRSRDSVELLLGPGERARVALARIDELEIDTAEQVTAIAGALALTGRIDAGRWAVVTSGTRPLATARLRAAGFTLPATVVTADDVENGKPAPDGYRSAAEQLGVDPADAVVLEDAAKGIEAARAAGIGFVIGVGARVTGLDGPGRPDALVADLRAVHWTGSGLEIAD